MMFLRSLPALGQNAMWPVQRGCPHCARPGTDGQGLSCVRQILLKMGGYGFLRFSAYRCSLWALTCWHRWCCGCGEGGGGGAGGGVRLFYTSLAGTGAAGMKKLIAIVGGATGLCDDGDLYL